MSVRTVRIANDAHAPPTALCHLGLRLFTLVLSSPRIRRFYLPYTKKIPSPETGKGTEIGGYEVYLVKGFTKAR